MFWTFLRRSYHKKMFAIVKINNLLGKIQPGGLNTYYEKNYAPKSLKQENV